MMMRILLSNLAVVLAIYLFYCWIVPEFISGYRSYAPFIVGVLVAWGLSWSGIQHNGHNLLISIGGGALCALLVAGASLAAIVATRGG